jgi:hypothetical protein
MRLPAGPPPLLGGAPRKRVLDIENSHAQEVRGDGLIEMFGEMFETLQFLPQRVQSEYAARDARIGRVSNQL